MGNNLLNSFLISAGIALSGGEAVADSFAPVDGLAFSGSLIPEDNPQGPVFISIQDDDHITLRGNTIYFDGGINEESINSAIRHINNMERLNPEQDYEIVFNSNGGFVSHGYRLLDALSEINSNISVRCDEIVASMAFMSFIHENFDLRVAGEECEGMFHFPYYNYDFSEEQINQGAPIGGFELGLDDFELYLEHINAANEDTYNIEFPEVTVSLPDYWARAILEDMEENGSSEERVYFINSDSSDLNSRYLLMTRDELAGHIETMERLGVREVDIIIPSFVYPLSRSSIQSRYNHLSERSELFSAAFANASALTRDDVLSFAGDDVHMSAATMYALGIVDVYEGDTSEEVIEEAMEEFCENYPSISVCTPNI